MKATNIPILLDDRKVQALNQVLYKRGLSLAQFANILLEREYQQLVPDDIRCSMREKMQAEERAALSYSDDSVSLIRIHSCGRYEYFETHTLQSAEKFAQFCGSYLQDKQNGKSISLAQELYESGGAIRLDESDFSYKLGGLFADPAVNEIFDIDLNTGQISILAFGQPVKRWTLEHFANTGRLVFEGEYRTSEESKQLFKAGLAGFDMASPVPEMSDQQPQAMDEMQME